MGHLYHGYVSHNQRVLKLCTQFVANKRRKNGFKSTGCPLRLSLGSVSNCPLDQWEKTKPQPPYYCHMISHITLW